MVLRMRNGTPPAKISKWSAHYACQRAAGEAGWAGADSTLLKQERIRDALSARGITPPAAFLELGCGAGAIALWMARLGFRSAGVDVSPAAIQWARDTAAADCLPVRFELADLIAMPFDDGQFDLIIDADCFHMITGPGRAACFREVRRVLKPGGLLLAGGNVRDEAVTDPALCTLLTPDGFEYVLRSESELLAELKAAGFSLLAVNHHPKRGAQKAIRDCVAIEATREEG
jgi:SAM-dependent methyltransferase